MSQELVYDDCKNSKADELNIDRNDRGEGAPIPRDLATKLRRSTLLSKPKMVSWIVNVLIMLMYRCIST